METSAPRPVVEPVHLFDQDRKAFHSGDHKEEQFGLAAGPQTKVEE